MYVYILYIYVYMYICICQYFKFLISPNPKDFIIIYYLKYNCSHFT